MSIVGSGSLYLRGQEDNKSIAFEMYENVTGSNISLHELSELASLTGSPELGQGMSEFYGFQNQAPPETVTTSGVTSVSSGAATFNGSVTVASGGVTSRGFKWMSGNQSVATLISSGTEVTAGSGIGSFSVSQGGLSASTGYSYVAWAQNEAGRTYAGARTYFGTLARYTFSFTHSGYFCGAECNLERTNTATVDEGATATVYMSTPSLVGYCFSNCTSVQPSQIQGQYSSITNYPQGGNTWGYYVQKTGMNSNASGTANAYVGSASNYACACEICTDYTSSPTPFPFASNMCSRSCAWVTGNNLDGNDQLVFWLNKNAPSGNINDYFAGCGLDTPNFPFYGICLNGAGGQYRFCHSQQQVCYGESFIAGQSTSYGAKRGSGFRYKHIDHGPFTNTPSSDIRLKTNINYL